MPSPLATPLEKTVFPAYRMPAIQLTAEARALLVSYPWPGNVRQLKNITEQISIIETHREVTPAILQNYLPSQLSESRLPILFGSKNGNGGGKTFESEREILYQVLFDMRRDVVIFGVNCRIHGGIGDYYCLSA